MAACSGESSAISSPQPPISPGHDSHTFFCISTGIKQNIGGALFHPSLHGNSGISPTSLWRSRYIGDVPGKAHWECVQFNYMFCFEKNTGNAFHLFTIQATSEKVTGFILPTVGVWLVFSSAKSGKTTFPSIAAPKICYFSSWCTRKSRRISHFPFSRCSSRRVLCSRRCQAVTHSVPSSQLSRPLVHHGPALPALPNIPLLPEVSGSHRRCHSWCACRAPGTLQRPVLG